MRCDASHIAISGLYRDMRHALRRLMRYDAHWTAISDLCHNIGRISRYAAHCASSDALRQPTCRDIHRISQHPTRVATAQHVRHITAPTQPHVAMSAMSRHAAATCCPHIATAPPPPPALITAPPDPSRTPSRYRDTPPQYRDTHAQSRSHGPGAPTRKCPALVPRPPGSAAPPFPPHRSRPHGRARAFPPPT